MKKINFILITVVSIFVILILSYLFIARGEKSGNNIKIASYQSTDAQRPVVKTEKTVVDLGQMKVSDQKAYDFVVSNNGQKPLQLSNVTSSCGCTVGQIVYNGKESEEFGMHSQSDEVFEVASGKQAAVRVTYRPFVMPVTGPVTREVYIETNDPQNPRLVFQVKANVK